MAGEGVVCGSRAHLEQESIASRTLVRCSTALYLPSTVNSTERLPGTVLMYGFHACVWLFAVKTVKDTQCGFKVKL